MFKKQRSWVKALLTTFILSMVLVVPNSQALSVVDSSEAVINKVSFVKNLEFDESKVALLTTNPVIGWSSALPSPFNPKEGERIYFDWRLDNTAGYIKLEIFDSHPKQNGKMIVRLHDWDFYPETGYPKYKVSWNGKQNNEPVGDGIYYYMISTSSTLGGDVKHEQVGSFEVKSTVDPVGVAPIIGTPDRYDDTTYDWASPNPFYPDKNQTTTVNYSLNTEVDTLKVDFLINGEVKSTVNGGKAKGWNTAEWNGKQGSTPLKDGKYVYRITAINEYGSDIEYGEVEIKSTTQQEVDIIIGTKKGDDSDDYADRDPFNPYKYDKTTIRFKLNRSARVEFTISDGVNQLEKLTYTADEGVNLVEWNGRKTNNTPYANGRYYYHIHAWDPANTSNFDTENGSLMLKYDEEDDPNEDAPKISNFYINPKVFDPHDGETTEVRFEIDKRADISLKVYDGNKLVKVIAEHVRSKGSYIYEWDGRDRYGDIVEDGDYEVILEACNDNDCNTRTGTVRVRTETSVESGDLLKDIKVINQLFRPKKNEDAEICFTVVRDNTYITAEVLDGKKVVKTLLDDVKYNSDTRKCVSWDGRNKSGVLMDDDIYQFRLYATQGSDVQVEYRYIELDTDGIIIGFPGDNDYCGGFWDVPKNSPFCKAIELMRYWGVFTGYPDGSFRPYSDINRAEATKVILLALDYDILSDDGTNLGFWDVIRREWYMPFLRTAQRFGIVHGYPDGSFRPLNTMNRVELLKVFLEATDIQIPRCNVSPYADTPLNFETRWYMDYACFAKAYNLMDSDYNGNFYPDRPMTRADVAELFYRFEKRGLFAGYNKVYYDNYWNNWDGRYYVSTPYYTQQNNIRYTLSNY